MKKSTTIAITTLAVIIASNVGYFFYKNKKTDDVQTIGINPSLNQSNVDIHP